MHYRNAENDRTFNANGLQFGLKHLFPKAGREITMDGNYFSGKNDGGIFIQAIQWITNHNNFAINQQKQTSYGNNKFFTGQADFVNPLKGKAKIEAGLRISVQKLVNDNQTLLRNNTTSNFVKS